MKGILFKPDMIKVIHEGRKTVTRRLVKFHSEDGQRVYKYVYPHPNGGFTFCDAPLDEKQFAIIQKVSKTGLIPHYHVGEVVYIKEAHRYLQGNGSPNDFGVVYSDSEIRWWRDNAEMMYYPITGKWRSPLFLKEIFARYFIQIIDVRPERLREINLTGIQKEGFSKLSDFVDIWGSINPKYPFSSNPWVWRIEFKVCKDNK